MKKLKDGCTAVQLKALAVFCMVLDHAAFRLGDSFPLYDVFRFLGRLTAPMMAYFLAEGYRHTADRKKYGLRLLLFALLSWPPYSYFTDGVWFSCHLDVIFTLFLGFLAIWLWDAGKLPSFCKVLLTAGIAGLSGFGDWSYWMVAWCLIFYFAKETEGMMWLLFGAVAALYLWNVNPLDGARPAFGAVRSGVLLLPAVMQLYHGQRGKKTGFNRWFFYLFYPLHLLLLAWIFA